MSRVVKSVSFNLSDPIEVELFNHTKGYPNFSKFIKHLIQLQANKALSQENTSKATVTNSNFELPEKPTFASDLMKQLL